MARETSVIPQRADLALYAGDGTTLRLTVTDTQTGDPIDLTGTIAAQIRAQRNDTAPLADFAVDTTGATQGILELTLTGTQTADLLADTQQFKGAWDCQWTPDGDQPRTLIQGNVTCDLDVTRTP